MSGLSLVARDWDSAKLLMGRLSAVDQVQHGRSWRMALLRARFAEGPLVPFAQLGLGQWRVDPDMPAIRHEQVFAGQLGGGVELILSSWASIALEADCSMLAPEKRLAGLDLDPRAPARARPGPASPRGPGPGVPLERVPSQAEGDNAPRPAGFTPPADVGNLPRRARVVLSGRGRAGSPGPASSRGSRAKVRRFKCPSASTAITPSAAAAARSSRSPTTSSSCESARASPMRSRAIRRSTSSHPEP